MGTSKLPHSDNFVLFNESSPTAYAKSLLRIASYLLSNDLNKLKDALTYLLDVN